VSGRPVVKRDRLVTADERSLADDAVRRQRALLGHG